MKLLGFIGGCLMTVAFLLTVLFVGFKIAGVGKVADWDWYQVLAPAELYALWVIFWIIAGSVKYFVENRTPRSVRDPHHTNELLRQFRAWRWRKTQQKYNLDK